MIPKIQDDLGWTLRLAINLTTRIGKANTKTRPAAWRFENFSKLDEFVAFMVESRNDIDHPEDPEKHELVSGALEKARTDVEPFAPGMSVVGFEEGAHGSSVSFAGCRINGREVNGAVFIDKNGEEHTFGNVNAATKEAGFYVKSVRTAKGIIVPVPLHKTKGSVTSANEMAEYGAEWIDGAIRNLLTDEQIKELT